MTRQLQPAPQRRALTLIEMMVSVALTLMVVFALVRVFESLGNTVKDSRATMEMSGNLRSAAQLLQEDLAGLTVTALPPRRADQGEGYFELVDGPSTDYQHVVHNANNGAPQMVSLVGQLVDSEGYPSSAYDSSVGDIDDVLAFTTKRPDQPYIGTISDPRILGRTATGGKMQMIPNANVAPTRDLEAHEAEIVWWLQVERNTVDVFELIKTDASVTAQIDNAVSATNSNDPLSRLLLAQRYPNFGTTLGTPVRSLHRRVLLVRPDLDLSQVKLQNTYQLAEFISNNDISVRIIKTDAGFEVRANSLTDLTDRKNRAFRDGPGSNLSSAASLAMPGRSRIDDAREGELMAVQADLLRNGAMKDMILQSGAGPVMLRKGKDVVMTDVLAFDLKVWDPQAVIRISAEGTAMEPSDPGYLEGIADGKQGTYVDLGFGVLPKANLPAAYRGRFGVVPKPKSQLQISLNQNDINLGKGSATYCTWSSHYEHDGWDQDQDGTADQGTNGLDDPDPTVGGDFVFGIDDPGELETSPPYPHPIRGLKATLRVIDFTTRQIRQTSVVQDFLPE